ncbi:MAG: hypothetical protein JXR58_04695 [Bacteroidales bacterium]|nr:hypothetical protein [Bacteroidales bacterium]
MNTKNLYKLMAVLFASIIIVSTGCKKDKDDDPTPTTDYVKEMTDYMAANGMDLNEIMTTWTITAAALDTTKENFYIIDLRAEVDYNLGHIPGAVNTTLANVVNQAASNGGKPIVVVCYTGQTAAHGHVALKLSGFDSKILMWGMSSWNVDFDKWTANVSDMGTGNSNWSTTNTLETNVTFTKPTFTTTATTGQAILAERVEAMLEGGFKGVNAADVLATPTNYFINNYWALTDVEHYGHIKGAYRIKEDLTLAADGFKYLDGASTVVTYCWTGQTSSLITAYLTVLGYDAVSLKFGANGMIHSTLESHNWTSSGSFVYEN